MSYKLKLDTFINQIHNSNNTNSMKLTLSEVNHNLYVIA
jgi:hypothetical protein